jgi:hypothetical protein
MIYRFYIEGGAMDGEVVLRDSAHTATSIPQSDAWIDSTLGGVVGLGFPVVNPKVVEPTARQFEDNADATDDHEQIYQVVYRDEIAGNVIVRCRYVPWVDLVPPGIKRIVFTFEGGLWDGATDTCTIVRRPEDPSCEAARARYRLTESGTVGKRFGAGSDAALEMLKSDGPDATRGTSAALHIYEVMSRTEDGEDLLLNCRFIRSECRAV